MWLRPQRKRQGIQERKERQRLRRDRNQDGAYAKEKGQEEVTNQQPMTPLPQPTVQEAIAALSDRDEFKVIVQFVRDERERFFGDLRQCVDANEVMKVTGSIATLDELLGLLSTTNK